ncbi:hypothetical protein [Clostridium formicaceticum]|uniref:Uncharacterized protein n=1 Tax=Clostridium formicaceticum TaxID=1497 RepID=A0AAC9RNC0_9CLOT|nr:hypothetical protein [Clostridium formicaceticum]AOY77747.1 hypothetical protein BJL90_18920 [Clostridium formicaceticum]ARE88345.1 hypothetical protein CLFO_27460 [Clostridium formicaceticum]
MKKKTLVMITAALVVTISIGGYVFAQGSNGERFDSNSEKIATEESAAPNNHCGNSEEMVELMKENGFGDMAQWMEEGNFKAMDEFMNNLSEEDYNRMMDLMNENGYSNMSRMMESIGRDGMIEMHNSMMGSNGSKFNMMGNMMSRFR